jgi:radical SAM protein with 4Fe4S-binding SPASM domain
MRQIYVVLTERCNLSCIHCIRESSPAVISLMPYQDAMRTISESRKRFPSADILLTGGEPTLHPQFDQILNIALASGASVMVNSNGLSPFYKASNLELYRGSRRLAVQISLDGAESKHDGVRGHGTFRRAFETVRRLRASEIRTCVSMTVLDEAFFDGAANLLGELDELGLEHVAVKRMTYAGRGAGGSVLSTAAWNDRVYALRQLTFCTPLRINPMFDFKILADVDDVELRQAAGSIVRNCGSGTEKLYVYPNLDVCSCTCFKSIPLGNLALSSFDRILENFAPMEVTGDPCVSCRYFSLCGGGCLGSGFQNSGRLGAPDPRCPVVREHGLSVTGAPG